MRMNTFHKVPKEGDEGEVLRGSQKSEGARERPASIFSVTETVDGKNSVGFYVSMPGGGRKLVAGEAPDEEMLKLTKRDSRFFSTVAEPEEISKILESYGVTSPEELRSIGGGVKTPEGLSADDVLRRRGEKVASQRAQGERSIEEVREKMRKLAEGTRGEN